MLLLLSVTLVVLMELLVLMEALLLWDKDELVLAFPFDLAGDRERDCGDKYVVRNWPTTGLKNKLPL